MKTRTLAAILSLITTAILSFYLGVHSGKKDMSRAKSETAIRTLVLLNEAFEKNNAAIVRGNLRMSIMHEVQSFDEAHGVNKVSSDFAPFLAEARKIQGNTREDLREWSTTEIKKILKARDQPKTNQ